MVIRVIRLGENQYGLCKYEDLHSWNFHYINKRGDALPSIHNRVNLFRSRREAIACLKQLFPKVRKHKEKGDGTFFTNERYI